MATEAQSIHNQEYRKALNQCQTPEQRKRINATRQIAADMAKAYRKPLSERNTKLDLSRLPCEE